jgi:phenylacetate-CoA ligase
MLRELPLLTPYFNKKKMLASTEYLQDGTIQQLQISELKSILTHAAFHVSFYKENIDHSIFEGTDDPFVWIQKFPIIDKSTIRQYFNKFVCGSKLRRLKATTGGSTGQPFVFFMDRFHTRQVEKAFIFDQWGRVGYKMGDTVFNLRGRTPEKGKFIHHDLLFNIYYASSFNLKLETIDAYIKEINKIRPKYLHGYPSTMFQMANLIKRVNKKLEFKPKAVFCGSEKLFPFQRYLIEQVFCCKVYTWYGHSECLALGGECEYSHHLHFYPQYGYVELLPTGTRNSSGKEIYSLIATGFNNKVMPLIRYRTGDYAVLSDEQQCRCGRQYLLIEEILGREQEFLVDSQNELISATSLVFGQHFSVFAGIDGLYLIQEKPGIFSIILKKNSYFQSDDFEKMKFKISNLLEGRFNVSYEFTQELPKSAIGKAKLVHQNIDIKQFFSKQEN